MAGPSKVAAVYWTQWNPSISIRMVPENYNVIYLFAATRGAEQGAIVWNAGSPSIDDIKFCRSRGQKIVLSTGGAGQGISFSTRTVSQRFVNSVVAINSKFGGTLASPAIDGVDFNTFEAEALPNTTEYLWMFGELKRLFGSNFIISSPPAPWKQEDKAMIKSALAQGLMDFAGPQYYDGPGLADPNYIVNNVREWVVNVAGGDASKIIVGFGMESLANYSTIEQIVSAYKTIKQNHPNIRGAFLWQHKTDSDRGWVFSKQLIPLIGSSTTPTPDPNTKQVVIGQNKYALSGTDVYRDTDNLVVYTSASGASSPANQWGAEAVVEGGKVVSISDRQNTGAAGVNIPSDGYVLSGHGAARVWLLDNATVGAVVSGDVPKVVTPTPTPEPTPPAPTSDGIDSLNPLPEGATKARIIREYNKLLAILQNRL